MELKAVDEAKNAEEKRGMTIIKNLFLKIAIVCISCVLYFILKSEFLSKGYVINTF